LDEESAQSNVTVEIIHGYWLKCSDQRCPPGKFTEDKDEAQSLADEHQKMHEDHAAAVAKYMKEVVEDAETIVPQGINCPTCHVPIGQVHAQNCDVARCLSTGEQRALMDHIPAEDSVSVYEGGNKIRDETSHFCGEDVWTGFMPGEKEAQTYGVPINILKGFGRWDKDRFCWVMDDESFARMRAEGYGPSIGTL
jgi:hypothetical protein